MNVELEELVRRFGRTQAVAGVSLRAGPGVFGLLGPNGAGKTSLLRMMATVLPPTSGRLELLSRDPGNLGRRVHHHSSFDRVGRAPVARSRLADPDPLGVETVGAKG